MQQAAQTGIRWIAMALLVVAAGTSTGEGATCGVPSTAYPTIQSAVDDPACTQVDLAVQTFRESPVVDRDLLITGDSSSTTIIEGCLEITSGLVQLQGLRIDASVAGVAGSRPEAVWVHDGARVEADDVVAVHRMGEMVFADGFESSGMSRWSGRTP